MIEKICINKPKYGRYFLFSEAPGDDEDKEVETRDVTPEEDDFDTDFNNLSDEDFDNITLDDDDDDMDTDFNALGLDDIDDVTLDEPTDDDIDTNFNDMNDDDPTDNLDTNDPEESPQETNQNTEPTDNQEEPNTNQQTNDETDPVDDTAGAENPDEYADMDTDFNDDGTEEPTDDQTDDNAIGDDTAGTEDKPKGPGVEYDSTRKYVLFQKYISLYNAISNYIGKLENITKDDAEFNQVLKMSTNKLREIKNLTFEYMTIKFKASTYVQSLLFYQQLIVSVQLVFRTISNMNEEVKKKENKK